MKTGVCTSLRFFFASVASLRGAEYADHGVENSLLSENVSKTLPSGRCSIESGRAKHDVAWRRQWRDKLGLGFMLVPEKSTPKKPPK